MSGHSGLNKAIHLAAGENLRKACEKLGKCQIGEAKATDAYNLPCKYIIHTVGPVWNKGEHGEKEQLRSCYQSVLELVKGLQIRTIAFPSISTGIHGFPLDKAAEIAVKSVANFVRLYSESFDDIIWITRDEETKEAYDKAIKDREKIELIDTQVHLSQVPLEAINWNDVVIYGSFAEKIFQVKTKETVRAVIRYIELSGRVRTIVLPDSCIKYDSRFYIKNAVIEEVQKRGVLLCRTILHDGWNTAMAKELHADYSTLMRQHGYINTQKVVPTDMQRKVILSMLIHYNHISPKSLIAELKTLGYEKAHLVEKLMEKIETDIEYIQFLMETEPELSEED